MTENPLVSIIVPVYKVEAFLDRCVESLLAQSYENIEIILVDDGSPDACPGMCDVWAEKDHRIQVLHKANGGLSDARNQGVKLARGEYVCFVDSDDYVSPDHVEYLLGLLRDYGADIACGSFRPVSGDGESFGSQPEEHVACFDKISSYKALSGRYYMPLVTAWAKLFPADAVRANPFPPAAFMRTRPLPTSCFTKAEKPFWATGKSTPIIRMKKASPIPRPEKIWRPASRLTRSSTGILRPQDAPRFRPPPQKGFWAPL